MRSGTRRVIKSGSTTDKQEHATIQDIVAAIRDRTNNPVESGYPPIGDHQSWWWLSNHQSLVGASGCPHRIRRFIIAATATKPWRLLPRMSPLPPEQSGIPISVPDRVASLAIPNRMETWSCA